MRIPVWRCLGTRRGAIDQRGITLVELLVGMSIMTVISTMILMGWFSLSRSYSFSVSSSDARDSARGALSRIAREIRDAENDPAVSETSVVRARARWIEFYTTFNMATAGTPSTVPRLVLYRLYPNGQLWRFQDFNGDGTISVSSGSPINLSASDWAGTGTNNLDSSEQLRGEGATLMADHVVNDSIPYKDPVTGNTVYSSTPLFQYQQYDSSGNLTLSPEVTGTANRAGIVAVQIHLLVDLNPSRAPVYADFQTTAQLRNNR
jgi:type II secretory pathway pseudopilin PulG